MSTHAPLGIKFSDGKIAGCYVHYDGSTMSPRIEDFVRKNTTTGLFTLIKRAQLGGGIRGFHCPRWPSEDPSSAETDFLDDCDPYVINEKNWSETSKHGVYYTYLVDYDTGEIVENHRCF